MHKNRSPIISISTLETPEGNYYVNITRSDGQNRVYDRTNRPSFYLDRQSWRLVRDQNGYAHFRRQD